jgi:SHS2 domain-containing protein
MKYEEIEHTADLRLKVYGRDERELFANAAFALFDTMADLSKVEARESDLVEAHGADLEETLVAFLGELLYRLEGDARIYRDFEIEELQGDHVKAACGGEDFDASRHDIKREIKAVTYHDVEIERGPDGLSVLITCDV